LVCVVEGSSDTWKVVRNLMGATDPSRPLRARSWDLAFNMAENLIHGSDSAESLSAK